MALQKEITIENGVTLNYHRIALITIDINRQITIMVESYINAVGRQNVKDYNANPTEEPPFPYTASEYLFFEYDETLPMLQTDVIQGAYEWLKTQPKFEGALDV